METYCKAVQCLEERFNGLQLNHIARKHNEVADELAKIALGRTTVPPDVFASDLHEPSVNYGNSGRKGNKPPEPTLGLDPPEGSDPSSTLEPEVLEIDEQFDHDDKPDYRILYLARLIQGVLPQIRRKHGDSLGAPSHSCCWIGNYTSAAPQESCSAAFPSGMGGNCFRKYTRGLAATTQRLERWSGTPSAKASTGQLMWPTPPRSYAPMKGANSTHDERISQPKLSKRFLLHGPLLCGVST
jgi:hypothetical protein